VGQKQALKLKEIWEIRIRLQTEKNLHELALFNMAIDSKLRGCDLVKLKVNDVMRNGKIMPRAVVIQQKTHQPVHFEITEQSRESLLELINKKQLNYYDYLFKSRLASSEHLSTRQYAHTVKKWVQSIGLDPVEYGTHSMRRTKASLIYQKTKNIRVVQLLLGHSKLESTIRYYAS
jgi:integrase